VEPFGVATLDNLVELASPPETMASVAEWAASAHADAAQAVPTAVPRTTSAIRFRRYHGSAPG
jgi:hypothetical protein